MNEYFLPYKKGKIHYTTHGNGIAVIALHGFLETNTIWHETAFALPNFKWIAIDLLGHGNTSSIGYIHTMAQMADAVWSVVQALQLSSFILIGHSMGGYVALELLQKHPHSVLKMVLLNSTPEADSPERIENRNRAIQLLKNNHSTFIQMAIANLFTAQHKNKLTFAIEKLKKEALQTPLQGILAAIEGMKIRKDFCSLLQNYPIPIAIICGTEDAVIDTVALQQKITATNCTWFVISGGHMLFLENFVDYISTLELFLTISD